MKALLFVSELFWWLMFFALYGFAAFFVKFIFVRLPLQLPLPLKLVLAVPFSIIGVIIPAAVISFILPGLKPGTYGKDAGGVHAVWGIRFLLTRVLFVGPMQPLIQYSLFLRYLAWRALGADVRLDSMMSSDIPLPDMPLISLGAGSLVGSRSRLSTHIMNAGELTLGRITLGDRAVVGGDCTLGPACSVGDDSVLSFGVALASNVEIGKGVFIGKLALIGHGVRIGDGAVVETESKVPNNTVIPAGARWVNPVGERSVGMLREKARQEHTDKSKSNSAGE